ncbi:flagellar basal-body MS-ring/collar protein FliF [Paenibacillus sp. y28]|uniref:flagellar basal-body MS-ring/collar protein FliF n=1 Tax=Paenibacillus sp. y28 TaxID=3129110 RepID=UPI00301A244B
MNDTLIQYKERASQYWNQFNKTQKYIIGGIAVMLIAAILIVSLSLSKTEYATAFTDLQPNDAAAIKAYLDGNKVEYQLSPDGRSIGVPKDKVASVRLDVESQGLNKSGSLGYGDFSGKSTFGMSDNEFNVKYINAVQGELQQMFNKINGVQNSKVMITLPKENVFVRNENLQESSAAVILSIAPGFQFDQTQIDTMYSLVQKSIPKMKYENITISDHNGEQMPYSKSTGFAGSAKNQAAEQFQIKKQFEADIQKKITSMLGAVLGQNKVIAVATATMNFDQRNTERNLVTPVVDQQGIDISVQEIQKTLESDGGSSTGGVPGTGGTDVPGYPGSSGSGKVSSEEVQRTVNREVNRIKEAVVSSPYVVRDLSLSVGIEPPDRNNPDSLTPETRQAVEKLLTSIVSTSLADSGQTLTNEQLASRVTVISQTFAGNTETAASGLSYWLYGAGALALLLIGGLGYLAFRKRKSAAIEEEELAEQSQIEYPTIDLDSVNNESQVRKQLEQLAKKKPEEFVNLLRTWLVDE